MMGGFFSLGVHFLSRRWTWPTGARLLALLSAINCVPASPLQMVFAQQTAATLALNQERQLTGMIRLAWLGTLGAVHPRGASFFSWDSNRSMDRWKLTSAAPLWVTLLAVLFQFWWPMFFGVMQGQQNFLWYGWGMILNGIGRVIAPGSSSFFVATSVAGLMTGVTLGLLAIAALGIWQTRTFVVGQNRTIRSRSAAQTSAAADARLWREPISVLGRRDVRKILFSAKTKAHFTVWPERSPARSSGSSVRWPQ